MSNATRESACATAAPQVPDSPEDTSDAAARSSTGAGIGDGPALSPEQPEQSSRFFRGWVMLGVCTLILMATSPGQTFGVSVFNDAFRDSLGLSHSQLTGAYMLGTLLAALPLTYVGSLMDRFGPRRVLSIVIILFGGACFLTANAGGLFTIFLGFLTLRMFGQGAMGMLSGSTISLWFNRRLGFANGIRHVGMAGAIASLPALFLWLIDSFGWRAAYMILGVSVWVLLLPLMATIFRNRPEEVGQVPDGRGWHHREQTLRPTAPAEERDFSLGEAMRTRAYWLLMISMALWSMFGTAVLFNIVPIVESGGLDRMHAAGMYTTFAVTLAIMHIVAGLLADRLPLNLMLAAAVFCLAMAMGTIWQVGTLWGTMGVHGFGMLLGITQGTLLALGPPLMVRYFGRASIGSIQGSMATVLVAASSLGPFLVGATFDLLGSYDMILMLFTFIPLPVAIAAVFATRPPYPPPSRQRHG